MARMSVDERVERVHEVRGWALSRIEQCRMDEAKHGTGMCAIEAAAERRALQAVLRMLGFEDSQSPPPDAGRESK